MKQALSICSVFAAVIVSVGPALAQRLAVCGTGVDDASSMPTCQRSLGTFALVEVKAAPNPRLDALPPAMRAFSASFPQLRVHCQVSMGALISPERFLDRNVAQWTHRLYSQKIVDYVLQDRRGGKIVALVELDDATHRRRRDQARDVLTGIAGYRTIRLCASERPTLDSVRTTISHALVWQLYWRE